MRGRAKQSRGQRSRVPSEVSRTGHHPAAGHHKSSEPDHPADSHQAATPPRVKGLLVVGARIARCCSAALGALNWHSGSLARLVCQRWVVRVVTPDNESTKSPLSSAVSPLGDLSSGTEPVNPRGSLPRRTCAAVARLCRGRHHSTTFLHLFEIAAIVLSSAKGSCPSFVASLGHH